MPEDNTQLVKTKAGSLLKIQAIAKQIAQEVTTVELASRLASKIGVSSEEALELLENTKLEELIHEELISKLSAGSIAIKAMEMLHKKVAEGNMIAISLALQFNKLLKSNQTKTVTNLQINSEKALICLDSSAKALLGENKGNV